MTLFTAPLALAGLWFYFSKFAGRFRALGWMYVVPLLLFVVAKGRGREPSGIDEAAILDQLGLDPWSRGPKSRWLLITPTEVTGRAIAP